MLVQLFIGAVVVFLCIVMQSAMVAAMLVYARTVRSQASGSPSILRGSLIIGFVALWLMLVHSVSIAVWAITFGILGIFPDFDTAVYFAAVAFTTLGFGDVLPPNDWRQLAGLCAGHGLLMFGVSSAALVEVFRQSFEVSG